MLGVNAGASLGVALVVLTGNLAGLSLVAPVGLVAAASTGAGATLGLVLLVAHRVRNSLALLIFGIMFGYTATALVTILLQFQPA